MTREDRRAYYEVIRGIDMEAYRQRLEIVSSVDLVERLSEIKVPTLLFASGRDKLVPVGGKRRDSWPRASPRRRLHEFPRAGHALLLTPGFRLADYI